MNKLYVLFKKNLICESNLSVHQTGVSLRFTPAGDFIVITMTKDKKIRKICLYSYTRAAKGLPQDGQRICGQLENEARISLIHHLDSSNCPLSQVNKCNVASSLDDIDKERIRDRIDKEDGLLNSRTTIFLATNALLITATQISKNDPKTCMGIILFGLIVTFFWSLCSIQCWRVLNNLFEIYRTCEDTIDENILKALCPQYFRPNFLLGFWLPRKKWGQVYG